LSGNRFITPFEITTSVLPLGTGSASANPWRNSTLLAAVCTALALAGSSIAGVMSTPMTRLCSPTMRDAMSESMPAPLPIAGVRMPETIGTRGDRASVTGSAA
jgi:hypothetical protein